MHSRGKEDASGKSRAAAFPGTYPAPSPPRDIPSPHGADGGSSRGRPEHLQAMHRPGTCSAARDAAGIEPDPRNRSTRTLFPPPPPLQPLPSSRSIPHRARHSPCFAGLEMVPPSPGRDPRLGRHSPIGGVASVCRPTSWPGPSPSRKSLNWLSAPSRVVGKMNLPRRAKGFCGASGCWVSSEVYSPPPPRAQGGVPSPGSRPPAVPYVPSELLLLVLPSVDSRLPCRVTLVLISTAMPVSVLLRMLLRSFLGPPSGRRDRG